MKSQQILPDCESGRVTIARRINFADTFELLIDFYVSRSEWGLFVDSSHLVIEYELKIHAVDELGFDLDDFDILSHLFDDKTKNCRN